MDFNVGDELRQMNIEEILELFSSILTDREFDLMTFCLGLAIDFNEEQLQMKYIQLQEQGVICTHSLEEAADRHDTIERTKAIALRAYRKLQRVFYHKYNIQRLKLFLKDSDTEGDA